MISRNLYIAVLLIAFLWAGCSNDFLETEEKNSYWLSDTLELAGQVRDVYLPLNIPEAENSPFTVMVYPKWIDLDPMKGNFSNGLLNLNFSTTNEQDYSAGNFSGSLIIDIRDFGYLGITIKFLNQ